MGLFKRTKHTGNQCQYCQDPAAWAVYCENGEAQTVVIGYAPAGSNYIPACHVHQLRAQSAVSMYANQPDRVEFWK